MEFKVIASGSSGNCYILDDGSTKILIEAGVSMKKIKTATNFNLSNIIGCLATHQHLDHSGYLKDVAKAGIDIHLLPETRKHLGLEGHRYHDIELLKTFRIGTMQVKAFDVRHDVPNCAFLIASDSGERAAYITDTFYLRQRLPALDLLAIEINYSRETLDPEINIERKKRLYSTHMSLETAKRILKSMDLSRLKEIFILHVSKDNGDKNYFEEEIRKVVGKPTYTH